MDSSPNRYRQAIPSTAIAATSARVYRAARTRLDVKPRHTIGARAINTAVCFAKTAHAIRQPEATTIGVLVLSGRRARQAMASPLRPSMGASAWTDVAARRNGKMVVVSHINVTNKAKAVHNPLDPSSRRAKTRHKTKTGTE